MRREEIKREKERRKNEKREDEKMGNGYIPLIPFFIAFLSHFHPSSSKPNHIFQFSLLCLAPPVKSGNRAWLFLSLGYAYLSYSGDFCDGWMEGLGQGGEREGRRGRRWVD